MSGVITSTKLEQIGGGRGATFGQLMLFECMGVCVLSLSHESEMRGYLVYLLVVKYLYH